MHAWISPLCTQIKRDIVIYPIITLCISRMFVVVRECSVKHSVNKTTHACMDLAFMHTDHGKQRSIINHKYVHIGTFILQFIDCIGSLSKSSTHTYVCIQGANYICTWSKTLNSNTLILFMNINFRSC